MVAVLAVASTAAHAVTLEVRPEVVNVRAEPTTSSPVVSQLRRGSYVTLVHREHGWSSVEFAGGRQGWIRTDLLRTLPPPGTGTGGGDESVIATLLRVLVAGSLVAAMIYIYFLPGIIAGRRDHPSAGLIRVLNVFFGGTGVGWVLLLLWACSVPDRRRRAA